MMSYIILQCIYNLHYGIIYVYIYFLGTLTNMESFFCNNNIGALVILKLQDIKDKEHFTNFKIENEALFISQFENLKRILT